MRRPTLSDWRPEVSTDWAGLGVNRNRINQAPVSTVGLIELSLRGGCLHPTKQSVLGVEIALSVRSADLLAMTVDVLCLNPVSRREV